TIHALPTGFGRSDLGVVSLIGVGVLARAFGDVCGGSSQARGRLVTDQIAAASADLLWAAWCVSLLIDGDLVRLQAIAWPYAFTGLIAAGLRLSIAYTAVVPPRFWVKQDPPPPRLRHPLGFAFLRRLLAFGGLVTLASLGDFL